MNGTLACWRVSSNYYLVCLSTTTATHCDQRSEWNKMIKNRSTTMFASAEGWCDNLHISVFTGIKDDCELIRDHDQYRANEVWRITRHLTFNKWALGVFSLQHLRCLLTQWRTVMSANLMLAQMTRTLRRLTKLLVPTSTGKPINAVAHVPFPRLIRLAGNTV